MLWELVFMLVVLKIPVVYLCAVVWWAIKAEPRPLAGAAVQAVTPESPPGCDWRRRFRRPPARPRGRRGGPPVGARRVAGATMHARRAVRA